MIKAWAVRAPNQLLERLDFDPGELGAEEVKIAVEHCGICHSDISVMNNDWAYLLIPCGTRPTKVPRLKGRFSTRRLCSKNENEMCSHFLGRARLATC
jgi:threonine dehydrogenase-like Zn-dependent dehydrogenase